MVINVILLFMSEGKFSSALCVLPRTYEYFFIIMSAQSWHYVFGPLSRRRRRLNFGGLSQKAHMGHRPHIPHVCEKCGGKCYGLVFADPRSRSKVTLGSGMKSPVNALDFLKMALGHPFSQEGLPKCGSRTSSKTGDLDLFFKVTGARTFLATCQLCPFQ